MAGSRRRLRPRRARTRRPTEVALNLLQPLQTSCPAFVRDVFRKSEPECNDGERHRTRHQSHQDRAKKAKEKQAAKYGAHIKRAAPWRSWRGLRAKERSLVALAYTHLPSATPNSGGVLPLLRSDGMPPWGGCRFFAASSCRRREPFPPLRAFRQSGRSAHGLPRGRCSPAGLFGE